MAMFHVVGFNDFSGSGKFSLQERVKNSLLLNL